MAMNLVHDTQSNTQDRPTARSVAMLFQFEIFSARHHILCRARYICCLSVRLFVTRVDPSNTVEVRICNFHYRVAHSTPSSFCGIILIQNFWWVRHLEHGARYDQVRRTTIMTNRKLHNALSIGTKVDDLGWPWTAISSNFLVCLSHGWISQKRLKLGYATFTTE